MHTGGRGPVEVHGGRAAVGRVADAGQHVAARRKRAVVGRRGRRDAGQLAPGAQVEHAHALVIVAHIQPQLVCARSAAGKMLAAKCQKLEGGGWQV